MSHNTGVVFSDHFLKSNDWEPQRVECYYPCKTRSAASGEAFLAVAKSRLKTEGDGAIGNDLLRRVKLPDE